MVREATLLNRYAKKITRMPDVKTLNAWFSTNCISLYKKFSEDGYLKLTRSVSDKVKALTFKMLPRQRKEKY